MTAIFPKILGSPLMDNYGFQDQDIGTTITQMESGIKRRRQRAKKIPRNFSVSFVFDQTQLSLFEYFNKVVLLSQTLDFMITLKTPSGKSEQQVKYTDTCQKTTLGKYFKVTCELEVQ